MQSAEKLKTMMGIHAVMTEFERVMSALPKEVQEAFSARSAYVGTPEFDTDALNAYKASVGEDNFKLLVMSPAFKDMLQDFTAKFAGQKLHELIDMVMAATKEHGISHELTKEVLLAAFYGVAQVKAQGVEAFMRS